MLEIPNRHRSRGSRFKNVDIKIKFPFNEHQIMSAICIQIHVNPHIIVFHIILYISASEGWPRYIEAILYVWWSGFCTGAWSVCVCYAGMSSTVFMVHLWKELHHVCLWILQDEEISSKPVVQPCATVNSIVCFEVLLNPALVYPIPCKHAVGILICLEKY